MGVGWRADVGSVQSAFIFFKIWDKTTTYVVLRKLNRSPTGLKFWFILVFQGFNLLFNSESVTVFLILLSAICIEFVWKRFMGSWGWPYFKFYYWKCKPYSTQIHFRSSFVLPQMSLANLDRLISDYGACFDPFSSWLYTTFSMSTAFFSNKVPTVWGVLS